MLDFNITAIIQAVNFFIAVVVLNYLLIRPVRDIIKQRRAKMADMLASAETFASSADAQLAEYQGSLSRARQEAALARADARSDALREQQALAAEANKRAQEQLAQAKESLLKETHNARAALAARVKPLAAKAVTRLLG
ncbi:MAG: ATP synthase F0 subunit B [Desulfovibrionaceae bacterium]|nr:ATP synthase F0 subunit B [Desulfovibrionaceae bacterium]MCL2124190.1 ATP synthase F0 subunit B [Desulfovibrionaceae bacterium]